MGIKLKKHTQQHHKKCKSSLKPSPEKPSPSMSSHLTPLRTSRLRSKTKKVSHLTSKDSSLPVNNWKTAGPLLTTTSKKNPPSTWFSDSEVVCRSSSRP